MNEFISSLFSVITSVSMSDIDQNKCVTVTFRTFPFGPYFPETILVSGIHPTLGLDLNYDINRHHCQLISMAPGTPSHRLFQWKSCLRYAYILSLNTMYVHTLADVRLIISEARLAKSTSGIITFTKYDAQNCLSAVGLPQLYFDQLSITRGHITNAFLAVVHKAITGPKFNRRTLQKQLDCKDWLAEELIQVDNYDNQNMFGAPCTAPIYTSILFLVCLYLIKPHENDRKKVRGVCDGSTRGEKTMFRGVSYAPTPHHIHFRLQIALSAFLGM
jgi:hypothetical protein